MARPGAPAPQRPGPHLGRARHAVRRFDCGERCCRTVACHPAVPHWEVAASHDPDVIDSWWRLRPYSVLFATGHAFDVIEAPAALGRAALLGDGFVAAR